MQRIKMFLLLGGLGLLLGTCDGEYTDKPTPDSSNGPFPASDVTGTYSTAFGIQLCFGVNCLF